MASSGRKAMFDTPAANASETRIAMIEKISARCSCGSTSLFRKTVEMPTRMSPKG